MVIQWQSSGNPVCLELRPNVHWNATGARIVGSQCVSSALPVVFQWPSSGVPVCYNYANEHWMSTGTPLGGSKPVWFQCHPSVLVALVVFQCVPIMQINTGWPLEHHWVLASASVVPVASQCTYGSSGPFSVVCPVVSQCTDRIWFGGH